jgi:hypothetical protein
MLQREYSKRTKAEQKTLFFARLCSFSASYLECNTNT